jgi:hypothetical protein
MMSTLTPDIPPNLQKLLRRFERWRSGHAGRLPIPERLWAAAVELAREHGVFHTARALRLEYGKLKRLLESASPALKSRRRMKGRRGGRRGGARSLAPPPAFMELMTPPPAGLSECLIELEGRRGKMRIQWKGTTAPDLSGLSRALWESK